MFSGIVGAVGRVASAASHRLGIEHAGTAGSVGLGDSVAVNGACLTVTELRGSVFFADVVPETLARTNLGRLGVGDPVNLERSLTLDRTIDGHLVQGHVDTVASILRVGEMASGRLVEIELPAGLAALVAEKGSIAVDGTSLTVVSVGGGAFTVALIPHTLASTVAGGYVVGSAVNLEVDVLARYVYRILSHREASE